jgi:hypothetical protein
MAHLIKKRQIIEENSTEKKIYRLGDPGQPTISLDGGHVYDILAWENTQPAARRAPIPPKCVIDVRKTKRKMAESSISISALSVETGSQLGRGDRRTDGRPAVSLNWSNWVFWVLNWIQSNETLTFESESEGGGVDIFGFGVVFGVGWF